MSENGNDDAKTSDDGADKEGISDEQLPDDVRPDDDNPLAQEPEEGADDDEGLSLDTES